MKEAASSNPAAAHPAVQALSALLFPAVHPQAVAAVAYTLQAQAAALQAAAFLPAAAAGVPMEALKVVVAAVVFAVPDRKSVV